MLDSTSILRIVSQFVYKSEEFRLHVLGPYRYFYNKLLIIQYLIIIFKVMTKFDDMTFDVWPKFTYAIDPILMLTSNLNI